MRTPAVALAALATGLLVPSPNLQGSKVHQHSPPLRISLGKRALQAPYVVSGYPRQRGALLPAVSQVLPLYVLNNRGVFLGFVDGFVTDPAGRVLFMLVAIEADENKVRVVPAFLVQDAPGWEGFTMSISEARWRQAPTMDRQQLGRLEDEHVAQQVRDYYDVELRTRRREERRHSPDLFRPNAPSRELDALGRQ